ncbi:SDR family NAD(P)-dependent oxidoreductase [Brevibacterium casei]
MTAMRFQDKTVLITGATSGMGLAGARRLAREGASLILYGASSDRAAALQDEMPNAVVLHGDLADDSSIDTLRAAASVGLDGLWLNAGIAEIASVEVTGQAVFDRLMAVNVRGPFRLLGAVLPSLREGASIVVTASTSVYEGAAETSAYAASKGALVAAVRSWATELAPRMIRVNTLVPGAIDTDFRRFLDPARRDAFEGAVSAATALRRPGTPDEAAAVALFLLSDDASYVTGSQYAVDGGLTLV